MPVTFDRSFSGFLDPIIAPLWAEYSNGTIFYRSTIESNVLKHEVEMITDINSNFTDYQPSLAVVVTWDSMEAGPALHEVCKIHFWGSVTWSYQYYPP